MVISLFILSCSGNAGNGAIVINMGAEPRTIDPSLNTLNVVSAMLFHAFESLTTIGPDGKSYELHHVGQKTDSPLAVLTDKQHRSKGNYSTLHKNEGPGVHSKISDAEWNKQKREFWLNLLEQTEKV